jgi:hypothetical protein|tara:strand:- start:572 stop:1117 length:546 start_codon:yes stop_codon:yes gene_type:complete
MGGDESGLELSIKPKMPEDMIALIKREIDDKEAPFLRHVKYQVSLEWTDREETRLGYTRFECGHNELSRRKKLKLSPGPIKIALNPILNRDEKLYRHTLAHELLHAVGLTEHDGDHISLVGRIAPAPRLKDSLVLRELRQQVLDKLPERQWICGECGHAWDRRRVSVPKRCPKCARSFKTK